MATPRTRERVETWIWVLIYVGMAGIGLGIATGRSDSALGWTIAAPGALLVLAGVVLIVVRSKFKDQ